MLVSRHGRDECEIVHTFVNFCGKHPDPGSLYWPLEGERARSDHPKQAGLADLIAGVSHGHAASALSGQVEWRLVIRDPRAAEEIGAELGDRHPSTAQVR